MTSWEYLEKIAEVEEEIRSLLPSCCNQEKIMDLIDSKIRGLTFHHAFDKGYDAAWSLSHRVAAKRTHEDQE